LLLLCDQWCRSSRQDGGKESEGVCVQMRRGEGVPYKKEVERGWVEARDGCCV